MIGSTEIVVATLMVATAIFQILKGYGLASIEFLWSFWSLMNVMVLGLALRSLRSRAKQLTTSGMFYNERLMFTHFTAFTIATALSTIDTVLFKLTDNETVKGMRIKVAAHSISLISMFVWFGV